MKAFLVLLLLLICPGAWAANFLIGVLPDTQCEVDAKPDMFFSQMKWLALNNNTSSVTLKAVIGVGDLVNWDTPDHHMWKTASEGFDILDKAGIPYMLALGNHDTAAVKKGGSAAPGNVKANLRITKQFNEFFPVKRFTAQRGRYERGKSDNAWYTFSAGGVDWLVLTLELWPRKGAIDWAKTVVATHPNHNVIIVTHSYLNPNGTILINNGGYGSLSPQYLYDQLVSQYPNILLVLCGHAGSSTWRVDKGVKGNAVYQVLQDYQDQNYGGGYIRLLEVDTTKRTISAWMYSPYLHATRDDKSSFSFKDVKFVPAVK